MQAIAAQSRALSILFKVSSADNQMITTIEKKVADQFDLTLKALEREKGKENYKKIAKEYSYELIRILKDSNIELPGGQNISSMDEIAIRCLKNRIKIFVLLC